MQTGPGAIVASEKGFGGIEVLVSRNFAGGKYPAPGGAVAPLAAVGTSHEDSFHFGFSRLWHAVRRNPRVAPSSAELVLV